MKKTIAMILCLGMTLCFFSGCGKSLLASGCCGADTNAGGRESVSWALDESGVLTIMGKGELEGPRIVYTSDEDGAPIDSTLDYPEVACWYAYRPLITSVVIRPGVTGIGNGAFKDCENLTEIDIPEGVTSIGIEAFMGCESLTEIDIPDGVTSINKSTFSSCHSLADIFIPDSVTGIGRYAFAGCAFTDIKIPDGVTSLESRAFASCGNLTSIVIPEGVTSVSLCLFESCAHLTSVEIPASVTYMERSAFKSCDALDTVLYHGTQEQWDRLTFNLDYLGDSGLLNAEICFVD